MVIWLRPRLLGATAALAAVLAIGVPTAAEAHSLDSSTIAVQVTDTSIDAEVSVALETLNEALGTDYASSQADVDAFADEVITYIDDHLAVTGTDGTAWTSYRPAGLVVAGLAVVAGCCWLLGRRMTMTYTFLNAVGGPHRQWLTGHAKSMGQARERR